MRPLKTGKQMTHIFCHDITVNSLETDLLTRIEYLEGNRRTGECRGLGRMKYHRTREHMRSIDPRRKIFTLNTQV